MGLSGPVAVLGRPGQRRGKALLMSCDLKGETGTETPPPTIIIVPDKKKKKKNKELARTSDDARDAR